MEDLIPIVNKLQDVFSAIGQQTLDLPQIVVVGSQSSGKSSVLESIVGRGSGVVTRRPLVLQLYSIPHPNHINSPKSSEFIPNSNDSDPFYPLDDEESHVTGRTGRRGERGHHHVEDHEEDCVEWGEFLHLPGQRFADFSLIREEIQKETDRVVGTNKGVSKETINLKIYSPYVLNLTMVDLPGVTRVPVGDQPDDIERQIKDMCLEFISNPNAIIVAVSAANQDISNSDGLQLARSVDPDGLRTIGVLTKLDIMDQGTDAVDILMDRCGLPLRRGYVATINRSQQDILNRVSVRQGLEKEARYFSTHPKYRSILHKCGTKTMSTRLNQMLMQHIRDCLPGIRAKIVNMLSEAKNDLDALGECPDDLNTSKQGEYLLKTLSSFASNVTDFVDGKGSNIGVEMEELCGGARILYIFTDIFARRLKEVDAFELLDDQEIYTAMANSNGVRHPLYIPESSFDLLVKKQIARLDTPGLNCVDLIYDEMIRICRQVDATDLSRFPTLRDRVFECIHKLLRECIKPTQAMISNLVKVELAHINTSHPDFIGGKDAILTQKPDKNGVGSSVQDSSGATPSHQTQQQPLTGQQSQRSKGNESGVVGNNVNSGIPTAKGVKTEKPEVPNQESEQYGSGLPGFFTIFSKQPAASTVSNQSAKLSNIASPQRTAHTNRGSLDPYAYPSKGASTTPQQAITTDSSAIRLPPVQDKMQLAEATRTEKKIEIRVIKTLISSYFEIVKKTFIDMVPKVIMHFLVNTFKDGLQNELISTLYRESLFIDLLKETADVAAKRQSCREIHDLLMAALDIVNEVRDYTVFDK